MPWQQEPLVAVTVTGPRWRSDIAAVSHLSPFGLGSCKVLGPRGGAKAIGSMPERTSFNVIVTNVLGRCAVLQHMYPLVLHCTDVHERRPTVSARVVGVQATQHAPAFSGDTTVGTACTSHVQVDDVPLLRLALRLERLAASSSPH